MDPDDLILRPAGPDEEETLSHLIFRSRAYWDYPKELMEYWLESGDFNISAEAIETNPTYVIEDEEEREILGFYSMSIEGAEARMNHLWVMPEHVGTDLRSMLFLHACEVAETAGAETLIVVSDPHLSGFYEEMGAENIGEKIVPLPSGKQSLPILRMNI